MSLYGLQLLGLLLLLGGCDQPVLPRPFMKGAWLARHGGVGLDTPEGVSALRYLRQLGADWLAVGPEIQMPDIHRPELRPGTPDRELRDYLRQAKALGFHVLLLPRIESPFFFKPPFPFRGDIAMARPEDWKRFQANYRRALLHYARLAREERVGMLCIGLEYRHALLASPKAWMDLAKEARLVFGGPLTYSANWWKELDQVPIPFWKLLDDIGIGAYFEVAREDAAGLAALAEGWRPVLKKLSALHKKTGRPIIFTETGYPSFADAGRYPWKWQFQKGRALDPAHQATCYEALFRNLLPQTWFKGLFIWRFYTSRRYVQPWEYTPRGKPTEKVIRRWFRPP